MEKLAGLREILALDAKNSFARYGVAMELAGRDAEVDRRIGGFFKAMEGRVAAALSRAKAAGGATACTVSISGTTSWCPLRTRARRPTN